MTIAALLEPPDGITATAKLVYGIAAGSSTVCSFLSVGFCTIVYDHVTVLVQSDDDVIDYIQSFVWAADLPQKLIVLAVILATVAFVSPLHDLYGQCVMWSVLACIGIGSLAMLYYHHSVKRSFLERKWHAQEYSALP